MGLETAFGESVITSRLDDVVNWSRKFSFFNYLFGTACCAMEYMTVLGPEYDAARFGNEIPRFSPRQADLLLVIGTVVEKLAPTLRTVYDQMAEPKWVIAFGACASSGGFYDNYSTVQGIDKIIPVDIYIGGCPPRPEAFFDALIMLQQKVTKETVLDSTRRHRGMKPERIL
jgi:NADH-quinone oxidoreductase subunit B